MFQTDMYRKSKQKHLFVQKRFPKIVPFYEKKWKNVLEPEGPQTIQHGTYALHVG
jgi:hypothetical protein